MNKYLKIRFLYIIVVLFLFACKKENISLNKKSTDGKITIEIKAERDNKLDPYKVDLTTIGYGFKETVSVEIYNSVIDSSKVNIFWKNNKECLLEFLQEDKTKRKFHIEVNEDRISLREE